jgi:hypothetical protein
MSCPCDTEKCPYNPDNWLGALGKELPDQEEYPMWMRSFELACTHCDQPSGGVGVYRCPDLCDNCRPSIEETSADFIRHTIEHFKSLEED